MSWRYSVRPAIHLWALLVSLCVCISLGGVVNVGVCISSWDGTRLSLMTSAYVRVQQGVTRVGRPALHCGI